MKAKDGFVMREVLDEYMIIPIGDNIDRFEGTVVLNEVSAFIWERLRQSATREELLQTLLEEYEVSAETAQRDLDALLGNLREYGLLEE